MTDLGGIAVTLKGQTRPFVQQMDLATRSLYRLQRAAVQTGTVVGGLKTQMNAIGAIGVSSARSFSTQAKAAATFSDAMKTVGDRMMNVSRATSIYIALPLALFLRKAIMDFARFESAMRNVNTIARQSETVFKGTIVAVMQLAAELGKAPTELAEGLYDIVSAGFQGAEALEILRRSAIAARAGLSTTKQAARALTAILNAYGRSAVSAADVSDVLFRTVERGVITFDEIAGSIGVVASTASAARVPIEDVATAISVMTKGGIESAEAFTSLNRLLIRLITGTTELDRLFAKTEYGSAANMLSTRGLGETMQFLQEATAGSTEQFVKLGFMVRDLKAATSLTRNEGRDFAKELELIADRGNRSGTAMKAFMEQTKSLQFQLDRVKVAFVNMSTAMGETLRIELVGLIENVRSLLNVIAKLPDWMIKISAKIAVTTIALTGLGLAFGALAKVLSVAVIPTIVALWKVLSTKLWVSISLTTPVTKAFTLALNALTSVQTVGLIPAIKSVANLLLTKFVAAFRLSITAIFQCGVALKSLAVSIYTNTVAAVTSLWKALITKLVVGFKVSTIAAWNFGASLKALGTLLITKTIVAVTTLKQLMLFQLPLAFKASAAGATAATAAVGKMTGAVVLAKIAVMGLNLVVLAVVGAVAALITTLAKPLAVGKWIAGVKELEKLNQGKKGESAYGFTADQIATVQQMAQQVTELAKQRAVNALRILHGEREITDELRRQAEAQLRIARESLNDAEYTQLRREVLKEISEESEKARKDAEAAHRAALIDFQNQAELIQAQTQLSIKGMEEYRLSRKSLAEQEREWIKKSRDALNAAHDAQMSTSQDAILLQAQTKHDLQEIVIVLEKLRDLRADNVKKAKEQYELTRDQAKFEQANRAGKLAILQESRMRIMQDFAEAQIQADQERQYQLQTQLILLDKQTRELMAQREVQKDMLRIRSILAGSSEDVALRTSALNQARFMEATSGMDKATPGIDRKEKTQSDIARNTDRTAKGTEKLISSVNKVDQSIRNWRPISEFAIA